MFLARAASLRDRPNSLTASTVMPVRSSACTAYSVEAVVLERVVGVPGLGQVARGEVVGVDDDRGALGQVAEVGAQGRRVHRDQHVGGITGREDVVVGEVDLERRDAGQRALRGADLGREVGQRREVVAEDRGLLGEPVPGQLHAVARVASEPDDHAVEPLDLLGHLRALPSADSGVSAGVSRTFPVLGATPHDSPAPVVNRTDPTFSDRESAHQCRPADGARRHAYPTPMTWFT